MLVALMRRCNERILRFFLFLPRFHVFYVFNVFFIFSTFFYLKKRSWNLPSRTSGSNFETTETNCRS